MIRKGLQGFEENNDRDTASSTCVQLVQLASSTSSTLGLLDPMCVRVCDQTTPVSPQKTAVFLLLPSKYTLLVTVPMARLLIAVNYQTAYARTTKPTGLAGPCYTESHLDENYSHYYDA